MQDNNETLVIKEDLIDLKPNNSLPTENQKQYNLFKVFDFKENLLTEPLNTKSLSISNITLNVFFSPLKLK